MPLWKGDCNYIFAPTEGCVQVIFVTYPLKYNKELNHSTYNFL